MIQYENVNYRNENRTAPSVSVFHGDYEDDLSTPSCISLLINEAGKD
jgi:hypothetical protein